MIVFIQWLNPVGLDSPGLVHGQPPPGNSGGGAPMVTMV